MITFLRDLKYGMRLWLARPGLALAAVLALGIAIGATVTVYSVASALVVSPVRGIERPDRLVEVGRADGGGFDTMSYPTWRDIGAQSKSLDALFGYSMLPLNVRTTGETKRALGFLVTENYFEVLGVRASQGRLLAASDAATVSEAPVVVASSSAFQRWFGGDPAAVGRVVNINGKPYTLLGVADGEFRGHIAILQPDFYVPVTLQAVAQPSNGAKLLESRESNWLLAGGRLAPGASLESANSELATITARLRAAHPEAYDGREWQLGAGPLRALPGEIANGATSFSAVMGVLVLLVLLVACVNVAGMLIARGETRNAEIAMRYALGASRRRVVMQNLAENGVLAIAAGILGVSIAWGLTRALTLVELPAPFPLLFDIPVDAGVMAFALVTSVASALVFGLLPALRVSRVAPRSLASSRTLGLTREGSRLRSTLVVGQVALGVLLLVAAGIFMRALVQSSGIDPGFEVDGVVAADLDLEPTGYEPARALATAEQVLERVQAMPGVESAALVRLLPLTLSTMGFGGIEMGAGEEELSPDANVVSPGYFETLSIALQGRDFARTDAAGAGDVVVINARLAQRLFGDGAALGRTFRYGDAGERRTLTVVGVVADGKYNSLWEEPKLAIWMPAMQWPTAQLNLVIATAREPGEVGAQLRGVLASVDRDLPAPQVHAMRDVIALSLLPQRIASWVAGSLGAIAALLASIGLYGLVAFQVAARRREIGVRLALGASPQRIGREVAGGAAKLIAIGLAIGLLLSLGLAQVLASQLFGASAGDVLAFAGGIAVLVVAAIAACAAPVQRAARVAPIDALRDE